MHAENQLYLSRTVLASALNCDEAQLDSGPLWVLRREAMVDSGTTYVLIRHRRIAEVARDWLAENGYDVDQWYPVLARAALSAFFRDRGSGSADVNKWQYDLPRHFVNRGQSRWPLARAIAEALFNANADDPMRLNTFAGTLRRTGRPGDAMTLMRAHGPRYKRRRDVLYEWGVAAGSVGDHGFAVWLAARSLADDHSYPLDEKRCKLSLAGLGASFRELAASTIQTEFIEAQAACGRLGLRLADLDPKAESYLEEHAQAAPWCADQPGSLEKDIKIFQESVVAAYYETDPENDRGMDDLIGEPEGYKYQMLTAVLSGASEPRGGVRR